MRAQMDFCKYVDTFYGNGEINPFPQDGLASKWLPIKALCGNTTPHAVLPFGKMSVGAYSGGYPTGYGTHYPNYRGEIKKLSDKQKIRGFSHLHQSGTGGIGYYYNYAVTTPFYGEINQITKYYENKNEKAVPGYYSTEFCDVFCELTTNENTAVHRYTFPLKNGRIAIDFSNDGLLREFGDNFYSYVKEPYIEIVSLNEALFSGIISGVKLYFCVTVEGNNINCSLFANNEESNEKNIEITDNTQNFGVIFNCEGKEATLKISYSTISCAKARENIFSTPSFDEVRKYAYKVWNNHLSVIDISVADEDFKRKFYSNFYHSIIKPCDMTGEQVLGISENLVTDFATFWDQYKTVLPLIFMLYPKMSKKIASAIVNISRSLKKIPCSLGLTDNFPCEEQAKMLGIFALCDAFYFNCENVGKEEIDECIKRELSREDFFEFLKNGTFERYTHILDATEACLDVAEITDNKILKNELLELAKNWINAYDTASGLMSDNSRYYEGDKYTYSFRLQRTMKERIALAGGNEKFASLLDDFFGFTENNIAATTRDGANRGAQRIYNRFEAFNNECDMETPYAYIYAGRHDKTCEIIHEGITKSFTLGKGGLPGNNDSGGLSSCFIWNVLGLFPVSGSGEFLIGSPHIEEATIWLSNNNKLKIKVNNFNNEKYYVDKVSFNGEEITAFRIPVRKIMQGGIIEFHMKAAN